MLQAAFNYPAEQVKALYSSLFSPYLAINGGAPWHSLYLFLFSNGRCCTEQGGLTVPGNYQLTPSEPELVPCGPLAWGMEVPLCWPQVYIIKKLSYQSVLLPIPCLAFFCLCICVQRPTKMPLEPSWSPFIVDLFLTVLNRAIFLLFSLLTAAMGLFIL